MSPGPTRGAQADRDLEAELKAERAATAHWRRVAHQRAVEFTALRRRPFVRATLAAERRLAPVGQRILRLTNRLRAWGEQTALALMGLARRRPDARARLTRALAHVPAAPPEQRKTLLVVVGAPSPLPGVRGVREVDVEAVEPFSRAVRQALMGTDSDLVGIVLGTSAPLDAAWLNRLTNEVHGDVVAATPLIVHPRRPLAWATPHDGRVRSAGLVIEATADGAPTVRSAGAGAAPDPAGPVHDVDAASAACVVVDRAAYERAGGLPPVDDLDVAVVMLCARLRGHGGRVVLVPSAVVVDHRPVTSRRGLRGVIDPAGRAWREAINRSGPALLRPSQTLTGSARRFVLTVAAPSEKVAARWGDWHLAEGLAGGLRRLGHDVRVQTMAEADEPASRSRDVHVVLRGLEPVRRSPGQRHVLWVISHPESIGGAELEAADLVLVASPMFAAHLRTRTSTPVEVLLQATDPRRFHPRPPNPAHRHDVTVVAKARGVMRPVVADALTVGLRPAIYGGGWHGLVDPELLIADHIHNDQLPIVYSSAGVVLNDHWRTMQAWGFVSNRLFDVLACGTPVISDPVAGLEELFDGAVLEYHDPEELRALVDAVLSDPDAARRRAERGRARVLAAHTFDHRAHELLALIDQDAKSAGSREVR